jgi:hypothetical protein
MVDSVSATSVIGSVTSDSTNTNVASTADAKLPKGFLDAVAAAAVADGKPALVAPPPGLSYGNFSSAIDNQVRDVAAYTKDNQKHVSHDGTIDLKGLINDKHHVPPNIRAEAKLIMKVLGIKELSPEPTMPAGAQVGTADPLSKIGTAGSSAPGFIPGSVN